MTASALSFRLAVLFVLIGMAAGIWMAASGDHSIAPAHAHLNLLGWASLFLFGLFYERRPNLNESRIALIQVAIWSVGTAILAVAVAGLYLGYPSAEPVTAVSSIIVLTGMALFAYFVFSPSIAAPSGSSMTLAE